MSKQLLKKLESLKAKQAKLRDEFRTFADEIEEHYQNADEAVEALESAADAVSRLV